MIRARQAGANTGLFAKYQNFVNDNDNKADDATAMAIPQVFFKKQLNKKSGEQDQRLS